MPCCPSNVPSHPRVTTLPSVPVRRVDLIPSLGVTAVGIGAAVGTATAAANTSGSGGGRGGRGRNSSIRAIMKAAGAAPGATAAGVAPAPDGQDASPSVPPRLSVVSLRPRTRCQGTVVPARTLDTNSIKEVAAVAVRGAALVAWFDQDDTPGAAAGPDDALVVAHGRGAGRDA